VPRCVFPGSGGGAATRWLRPDGPQRGGPDGDGAGGGGWCAGARGGAEAAAGTKRHNALSARRAAERSALSPLRSHPGNVHATQAYERGGAAAIVDEAHVAAAARRVEAAAAAANGELEATLLQLRRARARWRLPPTEAAVKTLRAVVADSPPSLRDDGDTAPQFGPDWLRALRCAPPLSLPRSPPAALTLNHTPVAAPSLRDSVRW
jgi:hypothetical protein